MKKIELKKLIRAPYYYVPKCPKCGSPVTGRYIKYHRFHADDEDVIDLSLRNGEIVDFLPEIEDVNCFCLSCGHRWWSDIRSEFVPLERIEQEKRLRGTNDMRKAWIEGKRKEKEKKGFRLFRR